MAEGTLVAEAPGSIASEAQEPSETEETSAPAAVETDGLTAGDETAEAEEDEDPRATVERLRKELAAEKYQREQSRKDILADLEAKAAEKAQADAEARANEESAKARRKAEDLVARDYALRAAGIAEAISKAQHLDDDGNPKFVRRADGSIMPIHQAWMADLQDEYTSSQALRLLDMVAEDDLVYLQEKFPGWKPNPQVTRDLIRARNSGDPIATARAQHALRDDAYEHGWTPKAKAEWEKSRAEQEATEAAAKSVEGAAKAREAAPKPTTIAGGVAAPNADWRDASPLSKAYRDGYRATYGTNPPGV